MLILLQYIASQIKTHKLRSFLLLFSIQLSTLLIFVSSSTYRNMLNLSYNQLKQECGDTDIVMKSDTLALDVYQSFRETSETFNDASIVVTSNVVLGKLLYNNNRSVKLTIQGIDLNDYPKLYDSTFQIQDKTKNFEEDSIIVSSKTIEKYHLDPEKPITLSINSQKYSFRIYAVSDLRGYFFENGQAHNCLLPKATLEKILGITSGKANTVYLKLKNPDRKNDVIRKLAAEYPDYTVKEPFTEEEAKQETESISIILLLITLIVFCISTYIIYSAFKVIAQERLHVLATFRSLGATLVKTTLASLLESLVLGFIGAVVGILLGIAAVIIIMNLTSNQAQSFTTILSSSINITDICLAFLTAILLSTLSSVLPLLRTAKSSIIYIISRNQNIYVKSKNRLSTLIGVILFVFSLVVTFINFPSPSLLLVIASIITFTVGVILIVPMFVSNLFNGLQKLFQRFFGNTAQLTANLFKNNKMSFSNIALIGIGTACIFSVVILSNKVISEIFDSFVNRNYDLMLENDTLDPSIAKELVEVDGVEDSYGIYESHKVPVKEFNSEIWGLQGIDSDKYLDYWTLTTEENTEELLPQLNSSRSILITNMLREKYKLEKGDYITLEFDNTESQYKIIGFFDSILFLGNYALVGNNYLQQDSNSKYFSRIYVKADPLTDINTVKNSIEEHFPLKELNVLIMKELKDDFLNTYSQFFIILDCFATIAILIGIFSVMNNTILIFMSQKKNFAIFRSLGMTVKDLRKMLIFESLLTGATGGFVGIFSSIVLVKQIMNILKAIHQPIKISYSGIDIMIAFIAAIFIIVISSIIPIRNLSKENLIETLKKN